MTPTPVDAYLSRLEHELRQRGLDSARLVAEAREHLIDAVGAGRQRGLSLDDAEREALERFGAPETVAAYVAAERDRTMNRFAAVLDTVWHRKWWILAPTLLTAVVTSVMSYYFLPTRYRSESIIRIVAPRVPADYAGPTATDGTLTRFQQISQNVLSRTRLERIIRDFGLYHVEQERALGGDLVLQMRRDISVEVLTSDQAQDGDVGGFRVSFVSSDPTMAMKITARLAGLLVEENLRERERQIEGTQEFIDSQLDDVRRRLITSENTLEELQAQNGRRPLSQADLLPYEVLQERYRALLVKAEESRTVTNLERRAIGEQFKVVDAARLPEEPVGPSRLGVNVVGTFAGLGLGLVLVRLRGSSRKASADY